MKIFLKRIILFLALLLLVSVLFKIMINNDFLNLDENIYKKKHTQTNMIEKHIRYQNINWRKVEILGNVNLEGIYEIPLDSTINDVINYVNGLKKINIKYIKELNDIDIKSDKIYFCFPK